MIDFSAVNKAIQNWARDVTGLAGRNVIWAEQNAPQPEGLYLTLRKDSLTPLGHDFPSSFINPMTTNRRWGGVRRFTLEINGYGDGAFGVLESLYLSIEYPPYRENLRVEGLTILERFPVSNFTGLDDTLYEERARMEFWMLLGVETPEEVETGIIEHVHVDETIKTYDKSILYEDTLIIPEP
jgi:hypothetical protein